MLNSISTQAKKLVALAQQANTKKDSPTKLLTITSGKGGVGKSTFCANIAYALHQKGYKVCVIDADIGLANMQVLFNVKPEFTLYDYIENTIALNQLYTSVIDHSLVLVAGKSGLKYSNHSHSYIYTRLVDDIVQSAQFDFVIVDTGAGLNDFVKEFLSISKHILAVTTTDPSALTDMYAMMKLLSIDKDKLMICFNHTPNYKIGETICDSLVKLGHKNRLNKDFMVKYIGNVETCGNISTTGRLRKLFVQEFDQLTSSKQLKLAVECLLDEIK
ncbi:MAG: P-loop NTPase [Campylobacterota bacterium]|nr:P-loop NTPase [Campylobacterota bacterium]